MTALRGLEKTPLPLSEATEESLNEQTEEISPPVSSRGTKHSQGLYQKQPRWFFNNLSGHPCTIGTPDSGVVVAPVKAAELIGQDIPLETLREYVENAKAMSGILDKKSFWADGLIMTIISIILTMRL